MTDSTIIEAILKVYRECDVRSFPIDCLSLLTHYGYKIFTYEELKLRNKELYEMCLAYSEDAFQDAHSGIIAYNQERPKRRIRFSLMHELGHLILEHSGSCPDNERQANSFSSNLLAPRMAVHYAGCRCTQDVVRIFDISYKASANAYDDYMRWFRYVSYYNMSHLDKQMYAQFFNEKKQQFVWNIRKCNYCGKLLYNNAECYCRLTPCHEDHRDCFPLSASGRWADDDDRRFREARRQWLYGE